ncbi:EI24 domain-containing protein [Campylobacter gastrosuis]|uniref:EI24 domain-containing protein n=1 Tax=Campylobacter gastrosuis TaxID=2974576 RepID=A0ABT7HMU6_9BACT|nr:EI24 domain-containing protein [Campylobacter gastrosuis]MDL0087826.1 EI24 domain-containing protein [Campylobacter gastrosuis]MDL0088037.1 EI24 domain-containing protein [Campylobacter gastrosuis]
MIEIFRLSIADFWSKKFIYLAILPLFFSIFMLSLALFLGAKPAVLAIFDAINGYFGEYEIVKFLMQNELFNWLINAFVYAFGAYLVVILSVFFALFVAGFLTPIVVNEINKRHYKIILKNDVSLVFITKIMVVEILKFLGILLVCLPLLFVPVLHFFVGIIPFFYIYYKFLLVDVASNILGKTKFELCLIEGGGVGFVLSSFAFYLVSLLPIVGLFFQLFFVIFLTHLVFRRYLKF